MSYVGYLKPYEARIRQLHAEGVEPREIASIIYREGARSPWIKGNIFTSVEQGSINSFSGIIRHILKIPRKKRNYSRHEYEEDDK